MAPPRRVPERTVDAGPKDAPLPSLYPAEPSPPAPVSTQYALRLGMTSNFFAVVQKINSFGLVVAKVHLTNL